MENIIHLFILIPFLGFFISLIIPSKSEKLYSTIAFTTTGLTFTSLIFFTIYWILNGADVLNIRDFSIYKNEEYDFFIDFIFDKISAVFLLVGGLLSFMISIYSKYYMHREEGYKRFFTTILFFYFGYNFTLLSGNFETYFIGWEVLGIASFLLIAYYRDRYLPVKNAVKVFSLYRIGDVGLLVAMWLSHHFFHENITFVKLLDDGFVESHLRGHVLAGTIISLMIITAAVVKSAQLPYSSWLPRAMEGPTPSSAIFYGSLSVHMGAYLLLRTMPFWEHQLWIKILIGLVGLSTALVTSVIARVQSTVKSQIAYASIAQIGIIFLEIALGFENLALIHFAGNAFLRTYQLLVSPSVVTYLIRNQFYHFTPREHSIEDSFPKRIEYSLYVLSLREWNLDNLAYKMIWRPLKRIGKILPLFTIHRIVVFFIIAYLSLLWLLIQSKLEFIETYHNFLPPIISFIGLIYVLKSYAERKNAWLAWILIMMNHLMIVLAVSFNEKFDISHHLLYLSGTVISFISGLGILYYIHSKKSKFNLDSYQGLSKVYPTLSFIFLLSCLGLAGFPITTTFIGEDLIFSHIHADQFLLAFILALSFVLNGIALIRMYARIFLGIYSDSHQQKPFYTS